MKAKKSSFVSVRVDEETKQALQQTADDQERPLSWICRKGLEWYVREVIQAGRAKQ